MNVIETNRRWNSPLRVRHQTRFIVLHHAAAAFCSTALVDRWHKQNGWAGIGYHFFVQKDGSVYRGRPEWAIGAHVEGKNGCSIGICAEGNFDVEMVMPTAQKQAIAALVAALRQKYPEACVVGHKEIGSSSCPGRHYPLAELKAEGDLTMAQYDELKKRNRGTSGGGFNAISPHDL